MINRLIKIKINKKDLIFSKTVIIMRTLTTKTMKGLEKRLDTTESFIFAIL